jgi:hypothetical protein
MWTAYEEEILQDVMDEEEQGRDEFGEYFDLQEAARAPRVYRVITAGRTPQGRPRFRLGGLIRGARAVRQALFPAGGPSAGVWVAGGPQAAREFARQNRLRNVTPPERHGGGRTHVHASAPGGGRSEHIFYGGRIPRGVFFD